MAIISSFVQQLVVLLIVNTFVFIFPCYIILFFSNDTLLFYLITWSEFL